MTSTETRIDPPYVADVVLSGQPDRAPYSKENPDGEFEVAADLSLARLIDGYRAQCSTSGATNKSTCAG